MDTRDNAIQTADEVEERATAAVDAARKHIADAIGNSASRAQSFAERQKSLGAQQIGGVARAVHSAAREFETEMPGVARSVHDAATRLDGAAESLRNRSLGEVLGGLDRFARDQPAMFLGAAILVGFAASRFLKSSAETADRG